MKKVLQISAFVFFLLTVVAIIPALIPDEEYTAGARQWLDEANEQAEIDDELNRFNAIVGFYVEADRDMVAEGAKLIAQANALYEENGRYDQDSSKANSYWNRLPLKTGGKLSGQIESFNSRPLAWLADNQSLYNDLIAENEVLLMRFRKLMTMNQSSRTLKLDYTMPYISYSGIMDIKKLNNLSVIYDFINGDRKVAAQRLQASIIFSRLMMAQSVDLMEKIIASKLLEDDLMTYSLLLDLDSDSNALSFTIANLNDNERTLLKAFKSEFASMSSMLVMQDFDDYQADYSDQNIVQYFIMKLYLKPKKIENKSHRDVWLHALSMENVTLAARSKADNIKGMDEMSWWDIYLDPLSYLLLAIATPSHHGYIDMIDHLDARISLLNLKSDIYTKNLAAEEISRYISTMAVGDNAGYAGSEFFWDRENSELTYAVPNYTSEDIPRVKLYFNGQ